MSTAILKDQPVKNKTSKDEAAIRAVIEAIHQAHHNKDAAGIVGGYTATRPYLISRRRWPIVEWTFRKRRRGSTHGKVQSILRRVISTLLSAATSLSAMASTA